MQTIDNLEPEFFRIVKKKRETSDTFTIELKPLEERNLPSAPGQFNMLYRFGVGEVPISISRVSEKSYVHTIKIVGSVTKALSRLEIGDQVGVRGPFGKPWPIDACLGKDVVLLAGGIGLAPLRPVIHHLLNHRKEFGSIALLYGAREPKEMVFTEEIKDWNQKLDNQVFMAVDFAPQTWGGNVGVVTTLIPRIPFDLNGAAALLCGPEIMLRFSAAELLKEGISEGSIYLAMERNMKCAIGHCGRCQYVPFFICKDGSILSYSKVKHFLSKKEL